MLWDVQIRAADEDTGFYLALQVMWLALLRWWADGKRWGLRAIRVDSSRLSDVQKSSVCFSLMNALLWLVSVFDIFLLSSVKFHDFHLMDDKTSGRIPRTEKRPEESDFWAFVQTMMKVDRQMVTGEARGDVASVSKHWETSGSSHDLHHHLLWCSLSRER